MEPCVVVPQRGVKTQRTHTQAPSCLPQHAGYYNMKKQATSQTSRGATCPCCKKEAGRKAASFPPATIMYLVSASTSNYLETNQLTHATSNLPYEQAVKSPIEQAQLQSVASAMHVQCHQKSWSTTYGWLVWTIYLFIHPSTHPPM